MDNKIYIYIRNIAKNSRSYISEFARKKNLSLAEALVILACGEKKGLTQKEIVSYASFDKSMITHSVKSLEEKRLIERRTNPMDKRSLSVYLTEDGNTLFDDLYKNLYIFNKGTLSSFSDREVSELNNLLQKLSRYMDGFDI